MNIIPDKYVVEIDCRVIPEEDKPETAAEFNKILEELAEKDKSFKYMRALLAGGFHNVFTTPKDSTLIKALTAFYTKVAG